VCNRQKGVRGGMVISKSLAGEQTRRENSAGRAVHPFALKVYLNVAGKGGRPCRKNNPPAADE